MRNRSSHYCGAWNDSYLAWSRIIHKPWLFALNDHHTVHKDGLKYSDPFHGHIYNSEEITYQLHYRKSLHTFTHMFILCTGTCCYIIFLSDHEQMSTNDYLNKKGLWNVRKIMNIFSFSLLIRITLQSRYIRRMYMNKWEDQITVL